MGLNFIIEAGSCCRCCSSRRRGGPAAATPPGSWGAGESGHRVAGRRGGGTGSGSEAGQSQSRRPLRRGAGRKRRSLQPGCRRGNAASARASAALHGARRPLASAPSCCCCYCWQRRHRRRRRGKSEARGSRHKETVVRTPDVCTAAPRRLRTAPTAPIFKWARAAPPPCAPPCARPCACVPGRLRRGAGSRPRGSVGSSEPEGWGCSRARAGSRSLKCPRVEKGKDPSLPVYKHCCLPHGGLKYHLQERRSDYVHPHKVAPWSGNAWRHRSDGSLRSD